MEKQIKIRDFSMIFVVIVIALTFIRPSSVIFANVAIETETWVGREDMPNNGVSGTFFEKPLEGANSDISSPSRYSNVSVVQAKELVGINEDIIMLDVRDSTNYNAGYIPRAISFPLIDIGCESCQQKMFKKYKDKHIIVYGDNNDESQYVCELLINSGFNHVYNLVGGITAWMDAGFPISEPDDDELFYCRIDQSLQEQRPVFLFFYTEWCRYSQQQKPIVMKLKTGYGDVIEFVDVNADENYQLATNFKVSSFPTMFLIVDKNENGYVYLEFRGFTDKNRLIDVFELVKKHNGNLEVVAIEYPDINDGEYGEGLRMLYQDVPQEGINYLFRPQWKWFRYFGNQCPGDAEQCDVLCSWGTALLPECFNVSIIEHDLDTLVLMGVKHVRLGIVFIYPMMNWDKETGYIDYNHPYYGTAILDNFNTVLDMIEMRGMKTTVTLMGRPAGVDIPCNYSDLFQSFYCPFFDCFETVKLPNGTVVPVYPEKHQNLTYALADFISMYKDNPTIVGWEMYGEIDSIIWPNSYNQSSEILDPDIVDFYIDYFYQMRQNIEDLWMFEPRDQNIGTSVCCYGKYGLDLWLNVTKPLVDFHTFSYYNDTGILFNYSVLGTDKEFGFAECGSGTVEHLYGLDRFYNVHALQTLWSDMKEKGYLPRIFNPWGLSDDSIIWTSHPSPYEPIDWLMDAWFLRTLYRPATAIDDGDYINIYFYDTTNYNTVTNEPEIIGLPGLMKINNIGIPHCWNRSVEGNGSWCIKCCCLDIWNCDCKKCKTVPCFEAAPPPNQSTIIFGSESLVCSSQRGNYSVQTLNNVLPWNVVSDTPIFFSVNLTSYYDRANVLESTAVIKNYDDDFGTLVDYCYVNDESRGLAGYQSPIEIHILDSAGTINVTIDYVYAGYNNSEGNVTISTYKITVTDPFGGVEDFFVNLTDLRYYEDESTPNFSSFRVGKLHFDYTITTIPLTFSMEAVSELMPVIPDIWPKNRCISFTPRINGGRTKAFRVTFTKCSPFPEAISSVKWVGPPDAHGTAYLQRTPYYHTTNSMIHVGDIDIMPDSTYTIEATFDGIHFSEPIEKHTTCLRGIKR